MEKKNDLYTGKVNPADKKPSELIDGELRQVTGGAALDFERVPESDYDVVYKKDGDNIEGPGKPGEYFAPLSSR